MTNEKLIILIKRKRFSFKMKNLDAMFFRSGYNLNWKIKVNGKICANQDDFFEDFNDLLVRINELCNFHSTFYAYLGDKKTENK